MHPRYVILMVAFVVLPLRALAGDGDGAVRRILTFPYGPRVLPVAPAAKGADDVQAGHGLLLSPQTIPAGTDDVLTIRGVGFGERNGARVEFLSAYHVNPTFIAAPDALILSWSDTTIRVRVPSTPLGTASSGPVRVLTSTGGVFTSSESIRVPYALLNIDNGQGAWVRPRIAATNQAGGLSFVPGRGFGDAETKALRRALTTFRCTAGVPFDVAGRSVATGCPSSRDGLNVVSYDAPTCALADDVPGTTIVTVESCGTPADVPGQGRWYVVDVDIVLNSNYPWHTGIGDPPPGQWDLESFLLHAVGHAALLDHVRVDGAVMSSTLAGGELRRSLNMESDVAGLKDVVQYSNGSFACGPASIAPTGSECSIAAPIAVMTTSTPRGCAPLTVQFRNEERSPSPGRTIMWDLTNDGTWDAIGPIAEMTYTKPGRYGVKVRVVNPYGVDELVEQHLIEVFERPMVKAGPDIVACAGSVVRLGTAATAGGSQGPYAIRWSPGRGLSDSTASQPTLRVDTSTVFTALVIDSRGCIAFDTVTVTVNEGPVIESAPEIQTCQGVEAQIPVVVSHGFPPFAFAWKPSAGLSEANVLSPIARPDTTTTYVLQVTDVRGCIVFDTVLVRVMPDSAPSVETPQGTVACVGDSLTVMVVGEGDWEWSTGARTPSIVVRETGTVSVRRRSLAGCATPWRFVDLNFRVPRQASITGTAAICAGEATVLDAGPGFVDYQWSNGGRMRYLTVDQAGIYSVTTLDEQGCTATSDPHSLRALVQPSTPSVVAVGSVLRSTPANAYQWYWDDTLLEGETRQTVDVRGNGSYIVEVWSADGCRQRSLPYRVISSTVSVDETSSDESVRILPLPADDECVIEAGLLATGTVEIGLVMTDVTGVLHTPSWSRTAAGAIVVELASMPTGTYVLTLRIGQRRFDRILPVLH